MTARRQWVCGGHKGESRITNAIHESMRDIAAGDEDRRPGQKIGKQQASIQRERHHLLVKAALSPNKPRGCAQKGVKHRPDDAPMPFVRLPPPTRPAC